MKRKILKFKKGFTLIEVIIAISMVIILASLSIPKITGYLDKAKDSNAISLGRQIFTAAMWSFSEKGGSFVKESVSSAIHDTTNIQVNTDKITNGGNSAVGVNDNFTIINVVYSNSGRSYIVHIDGTNSTCTIKRGDEYDTGTQIFSSNQ